MAGVSFCCVADAISGGAAMCETSNRAGVTAAEALPASVEWKGEVLPLEPVDELSVLTVCDNVMDIPGGPTVAPARASGLQTARSNRRSGGDKISNRRADLVVLPIVTGGRSRVRTWVG
jgi:hypothetical protein